MTAAFGRNENYEPVEGFEPIVQAVRYAFVLAVRTDSPAHDLQAMLRAAAVSSGAWQFGSAGIGTTQHLTGELLNAMGKVHMTHIPYRGDSASIAALLSGEIPLAITASNVAQPFYEAKRIQLLAVTGPTRSARLPDVPTVAEAALPGFDASTWAGLLAPRGTPRGDRRLAERSRKSGAARPDAPAASGRIAGWRRGRRHARGDAQSDGQRDRPAGAGSSRTSTSRSSSCVGTLLGFIHPARGYIGNCNQLHVGRAQAGRQSASARKLQGGRSRRGLHRAARGSSDRRTTATPS
ncbi:MAG: tripartite tricarboxylate transporter substrate binding protein [Pseudomonadota bacterium]